MVNLVQPLIGDVVVNGMAAFAAALVVYLFGLRLRERRQARQVLQARERERRSHWGYV